ncbi:transcriptional regulator, LacI family [Beutenbergia cavernae DSM 12333]|uniref:Transcriptional regulator, LacI family n=1 Tax=Beutenbergia cavernae (strain ATCC BAA-8 / DSM 12333 / CCUG 43141 / JCM 11478 / NBRC 16432 / NCIMB 13614 / HKI 0122) TaxID=471853 RepID=C5C1T6_BEUC1|nr:LacI family DNA-binding transcriptional regulator [Beutenbergia cavernae]ACQ79554.1 transcriptional regulator, LacI family [Beutenbergia cavernae DSM 12333]
MIGRPRQRDIARLAGVSQTTVSLALNGKTADYGINPETEQKIMAAARELGYVPNVTARALRGGRNNLLGVHAFEPLFPTSRESYYEEILVGIEQAAIRAGQDLVLFTSIHQHAGRASVFHEGRNRLRIADGAVILGFDEHDDELARLAAEGYTFVFVGRRDKASALGPYVGAAYVDGVADVTRRIHELGHRRVAYLGLNDRLEPRVERHQGFRLTADELGMDVVDERWSAGEAIDGPWLRRLVGSGATALLVESSAQLERVGAECAAAGIGVPDQLSVVGLDSITDPAATTREWSHLRVPRRGMGARAVEVLLEVLHGERELTHHELLTCTFEPGRTLAPPARGA